MTILDSTLSDNCTGTYSYWGSNSRLVVVTVNINSLVPRSIVPTIVDVTPTVGVIRTPKFLSLVSFIFV